MNPKIGIYEKAFPDDISLDNKFKLANNYGFDFVEICIDTNPSRVQRLNWSKDDCNEILSMAKRNNLDLHTISLSYIRLHPLGLLDEEENNIALNAIEKTIKIASLLGIHTVLINAYDVYNSKSTKKTYERMILNLKKAANIAKKHQIVIGLENAEMPVGNSIKKVGEIISQVNSEYMKIYADIGNSTNAHNGNNDMVIDELKEYKEDIVSLHVKDNLPNKFRNVVFGQGRVDFDSIFKAIRNYNIQTYVIEYFHTNNWEEDLKDIKNIFPYFFNDIG